MKYFKEQEGGIPSNYDSEAAKASSKAFFNESEDSSENNSLTLMKEVSALEDEESRLKKILNIKDERDVENLMLHKYDIDEGEYKDTVEEYFYIRDERIQAKKDLEKYITQDDAINN